MHNAMIWVAWYLLLLAVPFFIIASVVREGLARRRAVRRSRLSTTAAR
ncbi:MAG TPA: hypothetical protein VFS39_13515 [Nitrospira sp.]|nr:hypothetical protein [Nitrospira sp.]